MMKKTQMTHHDTANEAKCSKTFSRKTLNAAMKKSRLQIVIITTMPLDELF